MSLLIMAAGGFDDGVVALDYRPVDRGQTFLVPPDMRDWLPADHLVWFVLDVVKALDTKSLHARYRRGGVGRAAYDPEMLLGLVIYGYANSIRSSRQLERMCVVDVGFRVLCAQDGPDHSTLSRFIKGNAGQIEDLFAQVLMMCADAGMAKVGTVAVDGTKIAANASMSASKTRDWLAAEAKRIVDEGLATDAAEDAEYGDACGDELAEQFADPNGRAERIRAALRLLAEVADPPKRKPRPHPGGPADGPADGPLVGRPEVLASGRRPAGRTPAGTDEVAEMQAVYDRIRSEHQQVYDRYQQQAAANGGRLPNGVVAVDEHSNVKRAARRLARAKQRAERRAAEAAAATAAAQTAAGQRRAAEARYRDLRKANITDPDSRIMKTHTGYLQGYNAQAAVTADQIVIAADVVQANNDQHQLQPMMNAASQAARRLRPDGDGAIGVLLADAGYYSDDNVTAPGPDRLIATASMLTLTGRRPSSAPPPKPGTPRADMSDRLKKPDEQARYKLRGQLVEPVFGQIKEPLKFRRFSRRGLPAVQAEWTLICMTSNLLKLHRHINKDPG